MHAFAFFNEDKLLFEINVSRSAVCVGILDLNSQTINGLEHIPKF